MALGFRPEIDPFHTLDFGSKRQAFRNHVAMAKPYRFLMNVIRRFSRHSFYHGPGARQSGLIGTIDRPEIRLGRRWPLVIPGDEIVSRQDFDLVLFHLDTVLRGSFVGLLRNCIWCPTSDQAADTQYNALHSLRCHKIIILAT